MFYCLLSVYWRVCKLLSLLLPTWGERNISPTNVYLTSSLVVSFAWSLALWWLLVSLPLILKSMKTMSLILDVVHRSFFRLDLLVPTLLGCSFHCSAICCSQPFFLGSSVTCDTTLGIEEGEGNVLGLEVVHKRSSRLDFLLPTYVTRVFLPLSDSLLLPYAPHLSWTTLLLLPICFPAFLSFWRS